MTWSALHRVEYIKIKGTYKGLAEYGVVRNYLTSSKQFDLHYRE